jgi:hypothetical protein
MMLCRSAQVERLRASWATQQQQLAWEKSRLIGARHQQLHLKGH